ncbi:unnamed protein product, partial [Urochloa humidicola]
HFACKKLVQDMMYEARVQAIISFWALRGVTVKKGEARNMRLTQDQFISVPPWWIAGDIPSWTLIVDKWCSEGWVEMHESCRARRLKMPGPPHHQ